jgi:hypothetical protein
MHHFIDELTAGLCLPCRKPDVIMELSDLLDRNPKGLGWDEIAYAMQARGFISTETYSVLIAQVFKRTIVQVPSGLFKLPHKT